MLGIEAKAGATVRSRDFQHLRWFAQNLAGPATFRGVILYSGEGVASFGEGLAAAPFGVLWD